MSRRPLSSSYRRYSYNSYGAYSPTSVWQRNKPAIVVGCAIGLCCGTYACQWFAEKQMERGNLALHELMQRNFVCSGDNVFRVGRWWVLLTSSFAHVSPIHLGLNMICLWGFGTPFVAVFGASRFVGLWMFSALACAAASIYWQEEKERLRRETTGRRWDKRNETYKIIGIEISREWALAVSGANGGHGLLYGGSVGTSGVACGLIGFQVCMAPHARTLLLFLPMPFWLSTSLIAIGSAYCMATNTLPFIGHAGHLGGMAAGFVWYFGPGRRWLRRFGRF